MEEEKKKVSYREKNATKCPICSYEFFQEKMLTGGGRLIAGKLTDELRRLYEENKKVGKIYPLAYTIVVCPKCLYSSYPQDFSAVSADELLNIRNASSARIQTVRKFFPSLDFSTDRSLQHAAASFMLAVDVYGMRGKNVAPTFKRAVSSIRAAWLFDDLSKDNPEGPFKKISNFFYVKAYGYYEKVLDLFTTGAEPVEAAGSLGPDYDKNWGYEGVLYLYSVLTMKLGIKEPDVKKRIEIFEKTKRILSKVFGIGKSTKNKPGALIDMTRDQYDKINAMLAQWYQETGQTVPGQSGSGA
ncbi:MAG: DUF2225 domain-containing protein [Spirochaetota bacterium]